MIKDVENIPGARILDGQFSAVQQAIGCNKNKEKAAIFLQEFVEEAKMSGYIADLLKKFDLEVQRFILENPEIIIEAIKMYQQKKEQENLEVELQLLKSKSKELFEDDYSFVGGNKNGEIRLVEFIDYKCHKRNLYCKKCHFNKDALKVFSVHFIE